VTATKAKGTQPNKGLFGMKIRNKMESRNDTWVVGMKLDPFFNVFGKEEE